MNERQATVTGVLYQYHAKTSNKRTTKWQITNQEGANNKKKLRNRLVFFLSPNNLTLILSFLLVF